MLSEHQDSEELFYSWLVQNGLLEDFKANCAYLFFKEGAVQHVLNARPPYMWVWYCGGYSAKFQYKWDKCRKDGGVSWKTAISYQIALKTFYMNFLSKKALLKLLKKRIRTLDVRG